MPAVIEPATLASPRLVREAGDVLALLDHALVQAAADVEALERTKAILTRQPATVEIFTGPSRT